MPITALGTAISTTTNYFAGNNPNGQLQSLTLSNGNTIQFGSGTVGGGLTNNAATAVFANASGELIGTVNLSQINGTNGFDISRVNDVAALADGGFAVSYIGSGRVSPGVYDFAQCVKVFNADGTARGEGQFVHAFTGLNGFENQIVALPNGGFTMVYSSTEGLTTLNNFITPLIGGPNVGTASTAVDIRMRTFDANAVPTTAELLVTDGTIQFSSHTYNRRAGGQYVSDVDVLANGNIAITYMGERFDVNGNSALYSNVAVYNPLTLAPVFGERPYSQSAIGPGSAAVFNGTLSAHSFQSMVFSNGMIAGVYEVVQSLVYKVFLQLVDGAGNFINAPVDLLLGSPNATFTYRTWGMVALNDDSFVLATARNAPGGGTDDLFLRHYSTNGVMISELQIANTPVGIDFIQSLEKGPDGSLLVSWTNSQQNGGTLVQQRYVVTGAGEIALTGSPSGDTPALGGGNDFYDGEAGNDVISGLGGADRLYGDAGNDTLNGGTGADTLDGGTGFDTASFANSATSVQVVMYNTTYNTGEAAGDVFRGIEAVQGSANIDILVGDFGINAILGGAGGDWIDGTYGGDYLYGEAGNDSLVSRQQADVLDGGADFDYARYDYADAGLRAFLYDPSQNTGWAAGDTYVSIEGLAGSYFADDLRGDANQNIIYGLGGADFIVGLGGSDLLIGGAGQDLFHFVGIGDGGPGGDAIQDFVSGQDRISVTGAFFGLGSPGGVAIDSFRFVSGAAANLATSQFIYNGATRQLFYDIDGTGAGAQVLLATLQVGATMAAGDIIVI
jgi:hypothetical protein